MNALGSLSQMYMFILLVLLFLGSGLALWGFINFLISRKTTSKGPIVKGQRKATPTTIVGDEQSKNKKQEVIL